MDLPPLFDAVDGQTALSGPARACSAPAKRRRPAPSLTDCCRTCRLRKVKCSGNPGEGPCSNCARLDLTCGFTAAEDDDDVAISRTTPSYSHTEAGTLRKRAQRACSQCHSHKTKCSGNLPRCKRCESGGLACEYTPAKRRFTNVRFRNPSAKSEPGNTAKASTNPEPNQVKSARRGDAVASPAPGAGSGGSSPFALIANESNLGSEEMLVRRDILLRHVDAYMGYMYWLPCQGYLHPETTYREIQEGALDPTVAAAVCGITSVFVSPSDAGGEFGTKCSAHVEMYLFRNGDKFSDNLLLLFALSITFNLIRGEFAKVWQSFGVASRLMLGLRINWDVGPRDDQSFAQQESLRRVAWHLFHLDRMLAGGYEEYISCRADVMRIALPCAEAAFRENRPVNAERLYDKPGNHPSTINLHAYQLRLIDLRHRIQVTTKRLCAVGPATQSQLGASKIMADINGLQNELTRFHMSLPPEILLSDQTVAKYMASTERCGYVFLHTHLAISHIDLYRFSLPGQRDKVPAEVLRRLPPEFIARSQKQAVAHAMCLGRFCDAIQTEVDQMRDTGRLELAGDYSTFQMSTHCVRVLLVALQHELYRDITDVTTAPLWRSVEVDEAHIRFLVDAVQRVTRPWCCILKVAQQAYDHNIALIEGFNKTRKVADQRAVETMFAGKPDSAHPCSPGPDAILESIAATGSPDEHAGRALSQRPSNPSTPWIAAPPDPGTALHQHQHQQRQQQPPGIPLFLAQARNRRASGALPPTADATSPLPDAQLAPAQLAPAQQHMYAGDGYADDLASRPYGQGCYAHPLGDY
ncbi:uncharacterized protein UV8b_04017 [Ustilaginoidea virens]|uniref:Zn(2)-C6 fungal-type domain-containing protein n=1 Tax=Ustilaginoidea virens TaxID=1159556 RepID=A0A8E5MHK5_USTVR|nr:uncharacterized protein UV8b_04017 [Ustilaginoidea virens]QUC19776.1 hypothetical protein UV8b_04017 [Ustilaginoidea virens]